MEVILFAATAQLTAVKSGKKVLQTYFTEFWFNWKNLLIRDVSVRIINHALLENFR
jgi:hypothetical protein